jgi:hypothetical protein
MAPIEQVISSTPEQNQTETLAKIPPEIVASMLSTFEPENSLRPEFIAGLFIRNSDNISHRYNV